MRVYTEKRREQQRVWHKNYREKNKDKIRAYREKNKDKIRDRKKVWEENNRDKLRAYSKTYRENNRNKVLFGKIRWRENNKDKIRDYKEKNKHKILANNKERECRRIFATCETSIKARREMIYLIASEVSLETGIAHDVDHIIPISKGGINHEDFLMVTTYKYNRQKSAKLDHPLPELQYLILDDLVQLYLKEVS